MWIIYALISAIFAALVAIFGKIGIQGISSELATTIRSLLMFIILALFVVLSGRYQEIAHLSWGNKMLWYIVLSSLAGAISWLAYFLALKSGTVAKVMSIDRLSIVFAVILAAVFLSEKLTYKSIIGVVLMSLGAIIVALA